MMGNLNSFHYRLAGPIVLALGLVLAGCSGGAEQPRQTAAAGFAEQVPKAEVQTAVAGAPPFQQAILKDGSVTFEEYESAALATVKCLQDHGVRILSGPSLGPGKRYVYTYSGGDDE